MAGYTNGTGKRPEDEPPRRTNITSLEEVRKRAEAEAKAAMRAKRGSSVRDYAIGGIILVMALGMIGTWLAPLLKTAR
jgi:hypothetical protein